jgi:hypothetical protein
MVEENIARYRNNKVFLHFLLSFVIFASGIVIGVGGTIILVKQRVIGIDRPHKDANDITKMITERYALTPQQIPQVQALITNAFAKRKSYDDEENAKREADVQVLIADMKVVLTPEQFEQWNKDFLAMREKHKKTKN